MTLQQLQKQVLELPISERWTLVQILLESLQRETSSELKKGNLSRLRGIAKGTEISSEDVEVDYVNYLTEKYQ
ncbi:hypothetical protein [Nostoc sp.]|uniref:hypothetical protein n=1 Tax=Nostoc sp. TaxID=1180 RepID=UPI002FF4FF39